MLLQITQYFSLFKVAILSFVTAFVVAMLLMPVLIYVIKRFKLFDIPDLRKEHTQPVPTMGGIAVCIAMAIACFLWIPASRDLFTVSFFFSIAVLFVLGILDDLHNISVRNKFVIQLATASLIAFSGMRIMHLNGLFGIYHLPAVFQYIITIVAIAGVTNAFNLIDGIDGLAGGLGFMSLLMLGLFLTLGGDSLAGIIAFGLAGGLLGFLYYNFNPARIFMGDTGSLLLGFVISVLSIRLMQLNIGHQNALLPHVPVFTLGIVLIPVFDTIRVFSLRMWKGKSPFSPDKIHIHHLLTTNGWSHSFTAKLLCTIHGIVLILSYFLKAIPQEAGFLILLACMLIVAFIFQRIKVPHYNPPQKAYMDMPKK
jgi:UDP-N-acetylmuramyl pentapeptide phosphotransferase/UDP-N-acetylglucosamine-1-phosphate transferase